METQPEVRTVEQIVKQVLNSATPRIEDAVARGFTLGRLPVFMRTSVATRETGLSDFQLRNLRARGKVTYRKEGNAVVYNTRELFAELDALKIPRLGGPEFLPHASSKTNGAIAGAG